MSPRPVLFAALPAAAGDTSPARAADRVSAAAEAGVDALLIEGGDAVDPGVLAAALAARTRGTGLVPVVPTEHREPYHVARVLASLDHLGGGWAGWSPAGPVGDDEAAAFTGGPAAPGPVQRARTAEFVRVVQGLWDSFTDDAFTRDREEGLYFRLDRLRALEHRGEHYSVAGPLNIARPPQGHPVLVHRVHDPDDAGFAATRADVALVTAGTAPLVRAAARGRTPLLVLETPVDGDPGAALDHLAAHGCDGLALLTPPGPADAAFDRVLAFAGGVARRGDPRGGATLRDRLGLPRPADRPEPSGPTDDERTTPWHAQQW